MPSELVVKLRASKLGAGFAAWVESRWRALLKNPKLQPEPPRPPGTGNPGGGAGEAGGGGPKPGPKPAAPEEPPPPAPKDPEPPAPPKESEAARKMREQREAARKAKLDEGIKQAEQSPKYQKLKPEDRKFLEENPRNKELAYDPDTKSFKPDEARAALQAEADGSIQGPVTRAMDDAGNSQGADYIDGNGKPWDVKDARGGASKIVDGASPQGGKPGENILVDASKLSASEQAALEQQVAQDLPAGSGDVTFVPKR